MPNESSLAPLVERFFTKRLISERRDPATRAVLRSKNLSQSSRFSWQTYADTMANAYTRLAPGIAAEP